MEGRRSFLVQLITHETYLDLPVARANLVLTNQQKT
jgi:hypothetical protein